MDKKIYFFELKRETITNKWYIGFHRPTPSGAIIHIKVYGRLNKVRPEHVESTALKEIEKLRLKYGKETILKPIKVEAKDKFASILYANAMQVLNDHCAHFKATSVKSFTSIIKNYCKYIAAKKIEKVDVNVAQTFINYVTTKHHTTTANAYITVLRWLYKRLDKKKNPFESIHKYKDAKTPSLYFQTTQIQRLKRAMLANDVQLWYFVNFMYYAFIRPGFELRLLKISEILIDSNIIIINKENSKKGKLQHVIIPEGLLQIILQMNLDQYPENFYVFGSDGMPGAEPLNAKSMSNRHQAIAKSIGIDTIKHKLYSWKHTGVVAWWRANKDLKQLQLQLRHYSLDMVDKYLKSLGLLDAPDIKNNFPTI